MVRIRRRVCGSQPCAASYGRAGQTAPSANSINSKRTWLASGAQGGLAQRPKPVPPDERKTRFPPQQLEKITEGRHSDGLKRDSLRVG